MKKRQMLICMCLLLILATGGMPLTADVYWPSPDYWHLWFGGPVYIDPNGTQVRYPFYGTAYTVYFYFNSPASVLATNGEGTTNGSEHGYTLNGAYMAAMQPYQLTDASTIWHEVPPVGFRGISTSVYFNTRAYSSLPVVELFSDSSMTRPLGIGSWSGQSHDVYYRVTDSNGPGIKTISLTNVYNGTTTTIVLSGVTGSFPMTHAANDNGTYLNGNPAIGKRSDGRLLYGSCKITATDNCGISKDYYYQELDNTAPSLSVISDSGSLIGTVPPSFPTVKASTLTVRCSDDLPGDSLIDANTFTLDEYVQYSVGEAPIHQITGMIGQTTATSSPPGFSATLSPSMTGLYTFTFNASDKEGNTAGTVTVKQKFLTGHANIRLIANGPSFSYVDNQGISHGGYRTGDFQATATNAFGEAIELYVSIDGAASIKLDQPSTTGSNNLHLDDGMHTVRFQATDEVGNTLSAFDSGLRTWIIDTLAPVIALSCPNLTQPGSNVDLVNNGGPYFVTGPAIFINSSSDATTGLNTLTYRLDNTGGENPVFGSFAPVAGNHSYVFTATDVAGNESVLNCTITSNPAAISLGAANLFYQNKSYSGAVMPLDVSTPINADGLILSFSPANGMYSQNCYAPPHSVIVNEVQRNGQSMSGNPMLYAFSSDSSGNYTATIPFVYPNVPLADGPYTIFYTLTDASGQSSTGQIEFSIHRSTPASLDVLQLGRKSGEANLWRSEGATWVLPSDAVQSVLAADSLTFDYADSALDPSLAGNFSRYHVVISDPSSASQLLVELPPGVPYALRWGSENSRLLSVWIKDETAKISGAKTILVFKPQWGSGAFMVPQRQPQSGVLAGVLWQDQPIANGTRVLRWGIGADSSAITALTVEPAGSGGITLAPSEALLAGATITYQPVVDIASDPSQYAIADFVQQIRIEGQIASYQIPYSLLSVPAFQLSWIGESGSFDTSTFEGQTADGNNIHYQIELGIDDGSGGIDGSPLYQRQVIERGSGSRPGYSYSLWALCRLDPASSSLSDLKQALQSKKIVLRIDEWIGAKPEVFANPSIPNTSAQLSLAGIDWDVEAPRLIMSGMLESPRAATSSKVVSGTAVDAGGSGLKVVTVSWAQAVEGEHATFTSQSASCDASGNFAFVLPLADGQYRIQVAAEDVAGNQSILPEAVKVFDTIAPRMMSSSFRFNPSATDEAGNAYASSDGSIAATFEVDEIGGVGLAGATYQWTTGQETAEGAWVAAAMTPVPGALFDVVHSTTDTYTLTFAGAQDGVGKLHIRLVDKAGNSSDWPAAGGNAWGVAYATEGPKVELSVSGLTSVSGRNWVRHASEISASFALAVGTVPVQGARWNVQLVDQDGKVGANADAWSVWGAGFESVRSRVSQDGQSYRVQLQVRNANGVTGAVRSSAVFTKDGIGPQDVTASLVGDTTGLIAGQIITVNTSAVDPVGAVEWTWSYQRVDGGGSFVRQDYRPGSNIVIPSAGTFSVVFTATSGSGISVSASPLVVSVAGIGLFVNNQAFNAGRGSIAARWGYAGAAPASYNHRWIRLDDTAVLEQWSAGQSAASVILDLDRAMQSAGVRLADGERIAIEVRAFDDSGNLLADVTSAGSVVDTTPPAVTLTSVPGFVAPNDVWLRFEGADAQSGTVGGTVLVKGSVQQPDGSWSWRPVKQTSFASIGDSGQRLDVDLSGAGGLSSGDRIVVEVSLENGAGLTTTQESAIMIVDGTAPPVPLVIPMADAVRYKPSGVTGDPLGSQHQTLGFNWTFTQGDPESGTVQYWWKAYTNPAELADSDTWTQVNGQKSVEGLDYSQSRYGGQPGTYSDGTALFFAVKALNGVGLESVGYSSAVVLDSKAPWVRSVVAVVQDARGRTAIQGHVQLSSLGDPPSVTGQFDSIDYESGLASFEVQAGIWSVGQGFLGREDSAGSSGVVEGTLQYSRPLVLGSGAQRAQPGSIWMLKGRAVDNAGNEEVAYSAAFKVEGKFPVVTELQGNLSENSLSFSWQVDQDSDFIEGYQVRIGVSAPILVSQKVWSGSWKDLGYHEGDVILVSVTPITSLGLGGARIASLAVSTGVPMLAAFDYTRYFSDHLNVKALRYAVPGSGAVQQAQWRLKDARTGQILQDWKADYSGLATYVWKDSYTALIEDAQKIPAHGQALALDVRAQSQTGIWSLVTPSETILVDRSPAEGVSISRGSAYSNASGNAGTIDGWALTAHDGQSGMLAYQTALTLDPGNVDWTGATTVVLANQEPSLAWSAQGVGIRGASEQETYYAALRIQNGTEDWGPVEVSSAVAVSWTAPVIAVSFAGTVLPTRDSSGNALSNNISETVTLTSSEEGTAFAFSVNGAAYSPAPIAIGGVPPGSTDSSLKCYATVILAAPGTAQFSVTGRDLFGNEATAGDSLRFNEAPAVTVGDGNGGIETTPGKPLTLEELVSVTDDARDYPLSYFWQLGGGGPIGFSGQQSEERSVMAWPNTGTGAVYFQNGKAQVTSYVLSLTVTDKWGKVAVKPIPVEVHNTREGKLFTNEYWTGSVTLTGIVELPSGIELTLDSVAATVSATLGEDGIMEGGIIVDSAALLTVANTGASSLFDSQADQLLWRGILVRGRASGSGLEIRRAERGITLLSTGNVSLAHAVLSHDLIGVHVLGGALELSGALFGDNNEYGVKEDGEGEYSLLNSTFSNNGVNYYKLEISQITIDELNALPGNSGNR